MLYLSRVHFSARGSFLSWDLRESNLTLVSIRGGECLPVLEIPSAGRNFALEPWELTSEGASGPWSFCLYGTDGAYMRGSGAVTARWQQNGGFFDYVIEHPDGQVEICASARRCTDVFYATRGSIKVTAPRKTGAMRSESIDLYFLPDADGQFEIAYEQRFFDAPPQAGMQTIGYERQRERLREDFSRWEKTLKCRSEFERECAYVLWCNTLPAGGLYFAPAIVMSKVGMGNVWSWDNAFNALALAENAPQTALDQFLLVYRTMNGEGRVPDCISETREIWNFVKPPVQGWIYRQMMQKNNFFADAGTVKLVYFYMKRNTDWWLNCRGETPCYYHGNDSGEDNSTCFDACEQIASPDLLAFLSVQCALLADLANILRMPTDAEVYAMLAEKLATRAVSDYWDGEKLFVRRMDTGAAHCCDGLMPMRLLVLGNKLPADIQEYIVEQLRTRYLGKSGLASEALDSPYFQENGYWRGAVWAPDQIVFCNALRGIGQNELAAEIASKYKTALEMSGFSENTNAKTGAALCCKAYTWAANAYMLL